MSYIGSPAAPTIATVSDDTITSAKIVDGTIASGDLASGVTDLVNDTTPQLGGDLDLNSKTLTGTLTQDANVSKSTDTATTIAQFGTNDASDPLAIKFTARTGQGSNNYIAMDCSEGSTNKSFIIGYAGSERMRLASNGDFFCTGMYNATTGSGANLFVASNGSVARSTSSLKYKTDVTDSTHGLSDVMNLRPVTYKGINDGDKVFGGLIAEEVHEAGLTEFVDYDNENNPDALFYGNMVSLLVKAVQELKTLVDTQQQTIESLEARVATLESA